MSTPDIQFTVQDIYELHIQLEETFILSSGIRDENLLASAVNTLFQTFMGNDLYPSIYDKAAQLCYGIANNHPFTDGNKRTALHSMYQLNSIKPPSELNRPLNVRPKILTLRRSVFLWQNIA